ncbi:MAG TPA: vanadium-dependent haloperoxidase [Chryseolinea sp.]|nr:vanadium-dependent haloperoxidase [Chryseolinea sp.]
MINKPRYVCTDEFAVSSTTMVCGAFSSNWQAVHSAAKNKSSISLLLFSCATVVLVLSGCNKPDLRGAGPKDYPPDVAIAWIKMEQNLFVGTPGLLPHVTGRAHGYLGITLYESMAQGMPGYQSVASQLSGDLVLPTIQQGKQYLWPVCANAALACMLKNLLPHAQPALLNAVDSLESELYRKFQDESNTNAMERSSAFGKEVAAAIFEWSKTDGGHEAYKNPFSDDYVSPVGDGKWVATGEFPFSQPVYPYWGNNRTFVPGLVGSTQPGPPPAYSEQPGSEFYKAVNEIYVMSQNLDHDDSLTAKFWAYDLLHPEDLAEYEDVSHAANIATQIIIARKLSLQEAAVLYAKHAIALNDAGISCVKTKFTYNLVRPITYIRTVLGHGEWHPVIHTPPFPEYTSAHAAISMACAAVLEDSFGKDFAFTDHSFDNTYGPRSFASLEAYAKEAALSRLQGGIHYRFAMDEGLKQGKKVAALVDQLKFKK